MKYLLLLLPLSLAPLFAQENTILDADYSGGGDLILIERIPLNSEDKSYNSIYPNTIPLGSIYRDTNHFQYYYVKDGTRLTKTNGLTYKLDPKKQLVPSSCIEHRNFPKDKELLYAGYISPTERLYINPQTKEQFIKILEPLDDGYPHPSFINPLIFDDNGMTYISENIFYKRNPTNGQLKEEE